MLVCLAVNPIAGMGGSVGLKGMDGPEVLGESILRGAYPIAESRTLAALRAVGDLAASHLLTGDDGMDEDVLKEIDADFEVVHRMGGSSAAADTQQLCETALDRGGEVVVYVGGDGTARDLMDAVDERVPVIGIPSGVKMHSGVFSPDPRSAGSLLRLFSTRSLPTSRREVMDVDEAAFREGRLSAALYGRLLVPYEPSLAQESKGGIVSSDSEEEKEEIAQYVAESAELGTAYILGPGTTVEAVVGLMGVEKTQLGVDVVKDGRLIVKDASEADILAALDENPRARIIVMPIGAQGFILGRGEPADLGEGHQEGRRGQHRRDIHPLEAEGHQDSESGHREPGARRLPPRICESGRSLQQENDVEGDLTGLLFSCHSYCALSDAPLTSRSTLAHGRDDLPPCLLAPLLRRGSRSSP